MRWDLGYVIEYVIGFAVVVAVLRVEVLRRAAGYMVNSHGSLTESCEIVRTIFPVFSGGGMVEPLL